MESKHKNILIGTLLAVVFVMAVGYAAFAQQLTINGSAQITSTWDVHMEDSGDHEATATPSSAMSTDPTGDVVVEEGGLKATLTADLKSPGDKITYVIPIVNGGSINAKLQDLTLSSSDSSLNVAGDTATSTSGNIKYTVTSRPGTNLNAGADDTITVVAEYVDIVGGQGNAQNETVNLTITMNYVQA